MNHINDDRNLYVSKNATYEVKAEREDNMTGIANNKRETRVGRLTETLARMAESPQRSLSLSLLSRRDGGAE